MDSLDLMLWEHYLCGSARVPYVLGTQNLMSDACWGGAKDNLFSFKYLHFCCVLLIFITGYIDVTCHYSYKHTLTVTL